MIALISSVFCLLLLSAHASTVDVRPLRFPQVAQHANRIGWDGGVERVAQVIAVRNPASVESAKPVAAWFISLTFAPQQMRALHVEPSSVIEASAISQVGDAITMLRKGGWLDEWS